MAQQTMTVIQIHEKLVELERALSELKRLLEELTSHPVEKVCLHPVSLEGIWAGASITDADIRAARRAMFPYDTRKRGR